MSELDASLFGLKPIGDLVTSYVDLYIVILCGLWAAMLVVAWVRFDILPHGRRLFILVLAWPLCILEELIKWLPSVKWLSALTGLTYIVPVLLAIGLSRMLHPLLKERPQQRHRLQLAFILLLVLTQIPVILLPLDVKWALLNASPVGLPLQNLPIYASYAIGALVIVAVGVMLVETMQDYQRTLSEQVVDIGYYKMPAVLGLIGTLVGIGFCSVVLVILVAFSIVDFHYWQTTVHLAYATVFLVVFILMAQKRRYSPLPIELEKLQQHTFSDDLLRQTLTAAEQSMIKRKAYKVIGLRIRQLADSASVDPTHLAVATHTLLKRNFRAFVYHYRLEYAKKVLMRSDVKVSSVAKRLGFNSEKFLSGMFIKYIESMGDRDDEPAQPLSKE